jgi:hypothetical protein
LKEASGEKGILKREGGVFLGVFLALTGNFSTEAFKLGLSLLSSVF